MISTVKSWVEKGGYGFLVNPDGGKDIFVHAKNIVGHGFKSLKPGQTVEFNVQETDRGLSAVNAVAR